MRFKLWICQKIFNRHLDLFNVDMSSVKDQIIFASFTMAFIDNMVQLPTYKLLLFWLFSSKTESLLKRAWTATLANYQINIPKQLNKPENPDDFLPKDG